VDVQYTRNDMAFNRGTFRVRGDTVEIIPAYEELALRIEFFGDEVEALYYLHPLTGDVVRQVDELRIFPATHYVAGPERMEQAVRDIEAELEERLAELERQGKLLEAQRLRMRTQYDIEMIRQVGFCSGIENYSRHIDGRGPGTAGACLIDYFPDDFLLVIDESHVTVPQIGGMYEGDMSRKRTLVEHGFRLPSAMDNRPLTWEEFTDRIGQTVYLSATPGPLRAGRSRGDVVEQVIRPTGLVDPEVVVKPTKGQIDDLVHEIRLRTEKDERVLVTTLTKKMAEDLTDYLLELGIKVRYLHSEVDTLRRVELLRQLRLGRVRRARRHQPAARGARPARGVAGRDPRRRQGGLPALGHVADPDDRPGGAQRVRQVHMYADRSPTRCGTRSRRPTAPGQAGRLQHRARASTPSRCGRRSPTSSTRSTRRPRTPTCPWAGRGATSPRQARGRRAGPRGGSSGVVSGRDTRPCPAPSWPTWCSSCPTRCWPRPATCSSSWPPGCATRSPT
jgi:excinuclease ABC subunit B